MWIIGALLGVSVILWIVLIKTSEEKRKFRLVIISLLGLVYIGAGVSAYLYIASKSDKAAAVSDLGVYKYNIEKNGYKAEDWVELYVAGEYSACDLYTDTKLAYSTDMQVNDGINFREYNAVLTAMTEAIESISVVHEPNGKTYLVVTHKVYKLLDEPVYDKTGVQKIVQEYRLGEITKAEYVSKLDDIFYNSLYFTLRGNNEVLEKPIEFTEEIFETNACIKNTNQVTSEILRGSNILGNLRVYSAIKDAILNEAEQALPTEAVSNS